MNTFKTPNDRRREELLEAIREAARELLHLERVAAMSFPLDDRTQVTVGDIQDKPVILFDTPRGCVIVDGKECYTADELWRTAWAAEGDATGAPG